MNTRRGFSMIGIMVAAALAAIVAVFVGRLVQDGVKGAASSQRRQDIATLKMTLRDAVDCLETFNVPAGATLPLPGGCPPGPVVLRGKRPSAGVAGPILAPDNKMGSWVLNPRCDGGELIIGLANTDLDPMTKRPWSTFKFYNDLFEGTSDLCRGVVGTPPPCPPGRRIVDLGGTLHCVELTSLCNAMGFTYDAAKGRCIPVGEDLFGGMYQMGEKTFAGTIAGCESPNPRTGDCTCPPGYTAFAQNTTCEPPGCGTEWDVDFFCLRMN